MKRKLALYTLIFLFILRLWLLFFFFVLKNNPLAVYTLHDSFHHYYIGLSLLVVSLLLKKWLKKYFVFILAISIALVIDEYTLWLDVIGVKLPYIYLSSIDNIVTFGFCLIGLLVLKLSSSQKVRGF